MAAFATAHRARRIFFAVMPGALVWFSPAAHGEENSLLGRVPAVALWQGGVVEKLRRTNLSKDAHSYVKDLLLSGERYWPGEK